MFRVKKKRLSDNARKGSVSTENNHLQEQESIKVDDSVHDEGFQRVLAN